MPLYSFYSSENWQPGLAKIDNSSAYFHQTEGLCYEAFILTITPARKSCPCCPSHWEVSFEYSSPVPVHLLNHILLCCQSHERWDVPVHLRTKRRAGTKIFTFSFFDNFCSVDYIVSLFTTFKTFSSVQTSASLSVFAICPLQCPIHLNLLTLSISLSHTHQHGG